MSSWVKNLIGLSFVAILLVMAWKIYDGSDAELTAWDFSVKVDSEKNSIPEPLPVREPGTKECRLPAHGIESWSTIETLTADSGWRKGGSSPGEFCGAQLLAFETKYSSPDDVVLVSKDEKHKSEYTPFKHDYYRYACLFEVRKPVYHLAQNSACPST